MTYAFLHLYIDARASRDVLARRGESDGDALSDDGACESDESEDRLHCVE